ncbi:Nif3-like dinuclear metal center hexameric protein [Alcaligenes sp. SDU_A2]|uniref:Nif3-like dinuclear metal center hexameric protein n=1 Tax=Alcaligenes sp. SDU_A2 TaxID=3136634 RepID=UPI002D0B0EC4|nr:Nif3-like dinuclear metal center hexameric protein [Alcaligenes sp.]HRL26050.1 Nif3-like dinuclear metal center hexameric protein [Alcaligenes sp.]
MTQVSTADLARWLDTTLDAARFKDYCPNGLQVEGKPVIRKLVTGVTASLALVDAAIERQADAILVHHGWFWKNENPCVRGPKKTRLERVLQHQINLLGYHLPLDAHPELGNNAQLGRLLGITPWLNEQGQPQTCGPDGLVWLGELPQPVSLETFRLTVCSNLQREPLVVGDLQQNIRRIAWCTGGAQGFIDAAIQAGADLYITGEASEQTYHSAQENGIAFMAAGHHATERYGAKALGEHIARHFGIEVEFIDLDNPV